MCRAAGPTLKQRVQPNASCMAQATYCWFGFVILAVTHWISLSVRGVRNKYGELVLKMHHLENLNSRDDYLYGWGVVQLVSGLPSIHEVQVPSLAPCRAGMLFLICSLRSQVWRQANSSLSCLVTCWAGGHFGINKTCFRILKQVRG